MSAIRRCACGAPALVAVREWDRSTTTYGIQTSRSSGGGGLDWVCQACGAGHTVHDPGLFQFLWLPMGLMVFGMGLLVSCAGLTSLFAAGIGAALLLVGGGLIGQVAGPWAWRMRHPVVPDAPEPKLRYPQLLLFRRCACGQPARCVRATAESTNGIRTGTEYEHACAACGATFVVGSPLNLAVTLVAGVALTLPVLAFLPPGDAKEWLVAGFCGIVGPLTTLFGLRRLRDTLRHRAVAPPT